MKPYSFILLTLYLKPGRCWKVINSAADVQGCEDRVQQFHIYII